jgi:hypothetical protein
MSPQHSSVYFKYMLVHCHRFSKTVNTTSEFYEQECVVEASSIRSDHMLGVTKKKIGGQEIVQPCVRPQNIPAQFVIYLIVLQFVAI